MNRNGLRAFFVFLIAFTLIGCGLTSTRPMRQMNYAESAFQAATAANAETKYSAGYLLAKDTLLRARSSYRLKNFKDARRYAVRARRLSEEAEFQSLFSAHAENAVGASTEKNRVDPYINSNEVFKKEEWGD